MAVLNNAVMNIHKLSNEYVLNFLGFIPKSGIAVSYGNVMFNFEEMPGCLPQWPHFALTLGLHTLSCSRSSV